MRPSVRGVTLAGAGEATGVVVVVDVLRAFSTAAYALAAGAREIVCVATVEEALALRDQRPGTLVMGEVGGLPVGGFDLDNSPLGVRDRDLDGRTLVQRTTAGTQGVVRSRNADVLLAASFVCAEATVRHLRSLDPDEVTFVITGRDTRDGDEDQACADWIAARLTGERPDPGPYLARVPTSDAGKRFADPADSDFPAADLDACCALDAVDLALRVEHEDGHPVLRALRG
ncbi:MAG: 2-phosphosulfolactate phosphatase [Euzebyales bacterium]|nr:2-phosphosulfolactate phosphatase [Euzebyales bacterium]